MHNTGDPLKKDSAREYAGWVSRQYAGDFPGLDLQHTEIGDSN